jgi:GTP-binding protein
VDEPLYGIDEYLKMDEKDLKIDLSEIIYSKENDVYLVSGLAIERLYYSTNFEDVESLRRFQSLLMKKGVFDELIKMGIQDGDTVKIYDLEFEYYE